MQLTIHLCQLHLDVSRATCCDLVVTAQKPRLRAEQGAKQAFSIRGRFVLRGQGQTLRRTPLAPLGASPEPRSYFKRIPSRTPRRPTAIRRSIWKRLTSRKHCDTLTPDSLWKQCLSGGGAVGVGGFFPSPPLPSPTHICCFLVASLSQKHMLVRRRSQEARTVFSLTAGWVGGVWGGGVHKGFTVNTGRSSHEIKSKELDRCLKLHFWLVGLLIGRLVSGELSPHLKKKRKERTHFKTPDGIVRH